MKKMRLWLGTLAAVLGLGCGTAQAQNIFCQWGTSSVANLDWGTYNFYSGGTPTDAAAFLAVKCSGGLVTANRKVKVCANVDNGPGGTEGGQRLMKNGGDKVKYQIYKAATGNQIVGTSPASAVTWTADYQHDVMLYLPFYGRVASGQSAGAPGAYSSVLNVTARYGDYDKNASEPTCNSLLIGNPLQPASIEAKIQVETFCQIISVPSINFGSVSSLQINASTEGKLEVKCNSGYGYTIGANNGRWGAPSGGIRYLQKGSDSAQNLRIRYRLCRNQSCSQPWQNTPQTMRFSGTGNGQSKTHIIHAQVRSSDNPNFSGGLGTYTDTVVVTVYY